MKKEENDMPKEAGTIHISTLSADERLKKDVFRSDMDKLRLFTTMLRGNKVLNKAVVTHKN